MSTGSTSVTKTEPVVSTATIVTLVTALVAVLTAFFPDLLTEDQRTAILSFVAVAAPIVLAMLVRPKVTPNGSVVERVDGTDVIAGPANDMVAEGQKTRDLVSVE